MNLRGSDYHHFTEQKTEDQRSKIIVLKHTVQKEVDSSPTQVCFIQNQQSWQYTVLPACPHVIPDQRVIVLQNQSMWSLEDEIYIYILQHLPNNFKHFLAVVLNYMLHKYHLGNLWKMQIHCVTNQEKLQ